MRNRDKKSFPHFEGRIIQWSSPRVGNGRIRYVRIIGCDYHIGYTLVNAEDSSANYTCVNGPLSPNSSKVDLEEYEKNFQYFLDVVRGNKVYDVAEKMRILGKPIQEGSMANCAFK